MRAFHLFSTFAVVGSGTGTWTGTGRGSGTGAGAPGFDASQEPLKIMKKYYDEGI